MATDSALIDRIVSNVLAQLQPPGTPRAVTTEPKPAEPVPVAPTSVPKPTAIELLDPVITAKLLQDRAANAAALRFGPKSLITPSARDWLNNRKVNWSRETAATGTSSGNATPAKRRLLISTVTPTLRTIQGTLSRDFPAWNCDLIGKATEAVEMIIRLITTAEAELIVVSSDRADLVACYANRSPKVRATVASSADTLTTSAKSLGANVVVFDPTGKSYIELRNILRSCTALSRPQPPLGWD